MASGKDVLRTIDEELARQREQLTELTDKLGRSSSHLATIRQDEGDAYRKLADLRLSQITQDEAIEELNAAERHAKTLLERHEQELEAAHHRVEQASREIGELEAQRSRQAEVVERSVEKLDAAVERTKERLEKEPAYVEQLETFEDAESVAERAAQKHQLAEQDRIEKGAPYDSDPLFSYLWKRQFGTDDYSAFPIIRMLDGWVANLCRYDGARLNYKLLNEIPARLGEHARAVAEDAEAEAERLRELEEAAMTADGVDSIREDAEREQQALEQIDERIATSEAEHQQFVEAHSTIARGEGQHYRDAIEVLLASLKRKDLRDLRRDVERTPLPEDDVLVDDLLDAEREREFLEEKVAQESTLTEDSKRLLASVEWLRSRFKQARFDGAFSQFDDAGFLTPLFEHLARGSISRDTLWTTIQRRQRTRRPRSGRHFGRRRRSTGSGLPWGDILEVGAGILLNSRGLGGSRSIGSRRSSFPRASRPSRGSFGGRGGFRTGGRF